MPFVSSSQHFLLPEITRMNFMNYGSHYLLLAPLIKAELSILIEFLLLKCNLRDELPSALCRFSDGSQVKSWIWFWFLRFSLELFWCWQTHSWLLSWESKPQELDFSSFLLLKYKRQQENATPWAVREHLWYNSGLGVAGEGVQGSLINGFIDNVCITQLRKK